VASFFKGILLAVAVMTMNPGVAFSTPPPAAPTYRLMLTKAGAKEVTLESCKSRFECRAVMAGGKVRVVELEMGGRAARFGVGRPQLSATFDQLRDCVSKSVQIGEQVECGSPLTGDGVDDIDEVIMFIRSLIPYIMLGA
jgi:hypothetical protein